MLAAAAPCGGGGWGSLLADSLVCVLAETAAVRARRRGWQEQRFPPHTLKRPHGTQRAAVLGGTTYVLRLYALDLARLGAAAAPAPATVAAL